MVGQVLVHRYYVLPVATHRSDHLCEPFRDFLFGFCMCERVLVVVVVLSTLGEKGPAATGGIAILL